MDYEFIDDTYSVLKDIEEENEGDEEDHVLIENSEVCFNVT